MRDLVNMDRLLVSVLVALMALFGKFLGDAILFRYVKGGIRSGGVS